MLLKSKKTLRMLIAGSLTVSAFAGSAMAYPAHVNADILNMRAAPQGQIIGRLPDQTVVDVLDDSQGVWFRISANGTEGYVHSDYLVRMQEQQAGEQATEQAPLQSGIIRCNTWVNLREQPNTNCSILAGMRNGASVTVLGTEDNGWYHITFDGLTGYMHPDYLTLTTQSSAQSQPTGDPETVADAQAPSAAATESRNAVVNYGAQFIGVPYVYGGSTPSGFDCSGFTSYVYANVIGPIPRVAQDQFNATMRVSRDQLLPGDLVFFGSSAWSISHVGLYVGNNTFLHAPYTGLSVQYDTLYGTYETRFQGGGRVITG